MQGLLLNVKMNFESTKQQNGMGLFVLTLLVALAAATCTRETCTSLKVVFIDTKQASEHSFRVGEQVLSLTASNREGTLMVPAGSTPVSVGNVAASEKVMIKCSTMTETGKTEYFKSNSGRFDFVAGTSASCMYFVTGNPSKQRQTNVDLSNVWSDTSALNVVVGSRTNYTITLTAAFASDNIIVDAQNVVQNITLDSRLNIVRLNVITSSPSLVVTCDPIVLQGSVNRIVCRTPSFPRSTTFDVQIVFNAPSTIIETRNTTVFANGLISSPDFDQDLENNNATAPILLVIQADVSVDIAGDSFVVAGELNSNSGDFRIRTYTFSVCNSGPATAVNLSAVFVIPDELTIRGFLTPNDNNPSPTGSCELTDHTIRCTNLTMPSPPPATPGVPIIPVCNVYTLQGFYGIRSGGVNGKIVFIRGSASSPVADTQPINNDKVFQINITVRADLQIVKSGSVVLPAGTNGLFQMFILNGGPSLATGIVMTDNIPLPFEILTITSDPANACLPPAGQLVTCRWSELEPADPFVPTNSQLRVNVTYRVPANAVPTVPGPVLVNGPNNITNIAFVTGDQNDIDQTNNRDPHFVDIYAQVDLVVDKICPPGPFVSGEGISFDYTIVAFNKGPSVARNFTVNDVVPAELFVNTVTVTALNGAVFLSNCTTDGQNVTCVVLELAVSFTNQVRVVINVTPRPGLLSITTVNNTATVSSPNYEIVTSDNSDSCQTVLFPPPDLVIVKYAPQEIPVTGDNTLYEYQIIVTNNGPSTANNVQVRDLVNSTFTVVLPILTVPASNACSLSTGNEVICSFGSLVSGASVTVRVPFRVPGTAPAGTVLNCANVSATLESNVNNNQACNSTRLVNGAELVTSVPSFSLCAGSSSVQTITITNAGPASAASVTLSVQFPQSVTVTGQPQSPGTCDFNSATRVLSCSFNNPLPGQGGIYRVVITVVAPASGRASLLSYTATAATSTFQLSGGRNTASGSIQVNECADMAIAKNGESKVVAGNSTDSTGRPYSYTLTVTNLNVTSAENVNVTDTLPLFFNPSLATPTGLGGNCSISGRTVFCDWPGLWVTGRVETVTILFSVSADAPRGIVINTARVATQTIETRYDNNVATWPTTIINLADVYVQKTASAACIPADGSTTGSYSLTVGNLGPSTAYEVRLTDNIPFPLFYVGGSIVVTLNGAPASSLCSVDAPAGIVTCPIGTLSVGSVVVVTFNVRAPVSAPDQNVINVATVSTGCSPAPEPCDTPQDPNTLNNRAEATQCIRANADLYIRKTCPLNQPLVSGKPDRAAFTLDFGNNGPSVAYSVVISDAVDTRFTSLAIGSISPLGVVNCSISSNALTCTAAAMAPGASGTVVLTFVAQSGIISAVDVPNTASIQSSTFDNNLVNNQFTCVTRIVPPPDVSITKTGYASILIDDVTTVFYYNVVITNNGPGAAEGVVFNDTLPAPLTAEWTLFSTVPSFPPGTCSFSELGGRPFVRCDFGILAENGSISIRIPFRVPQTDQTMIQNCAYVSATYEAVNSQANNVACNATTLSQGANLAVNKFSDSVCAGERQVYEINVTNAGPASARDSNVYDQLPSQFVNPAVESVVSSVRGVTGTCSFTGNLLFCSLGSLAVGERVTIRFTYGVLSTTPGQLVSNTVKVNSTTIDLLTSDNEFTFQSTINTCVNLVAFKDGPISVLAGSSQVYQYRISFVNNGPSATTVTTTMSDPLPISQFRIVSVSNAACVPAGQTVQCTFPEAILPGQTRNATIFFTVDNDAIAGTVNNCVFVTGTPQFCVPTIVTTSADVAVTKTSDFGCIVAGQGIKTYVINVRNWGPSRAYDVRLVDNVPSEFVFQSINIVTSLAPGEYCTFPAIGSRGGTISCVFGNMAPLSDFATITYSVSVPASSSNSSGIINTATVTSKCSTFNTIVGCTPLLNSVDPFLGNNTQSVVTSICASADISVVKTFVGPQPVVAGAAGSREFSILVRNNGPSDAFSVTLTDLGFNGGVISNIRSIALGATCNTTSLTCFYSAITVGQSDVVVVTFSVPASQDCSTYVNVAQAYSSVTFDPILSNNVNSTSVQVVSQYDLVVVKTGQSPAIEGGPAGRYTVSVSNRGPSDALRVNFIDNVPLPLEVIAVVPTSLCTHSGQLIQCFFERITPNSPAIVIEYNYTVSPSAPLPPPNPEDGGRQSVKNVACANSSLTAPCATELVPSDNCDQFFTEVVCFSDLKVTKTDNVDVIVAGDGRVYTFIIDVTNLAGPSQARSIIAVDDWPSQYSPPNGAARLTVSVNTTGSTTTVAPDNTFTVNLAPLNVGQTARISVSYVVLATVPAGFVTNRVSVSGECRDMDGSNNNASDTNQIVNNADVSIIKDDCIDLLIAGGQPATFTFTVTNTGPSDAKLVHVVDIFPVEYQLVGDLPSVLTGPSPIRCTSFVVAATGAKGWDCEYAVIAVGQVYRLIQEYFVASTVLPKAHVVNCADVPLPLSGNVTDTDPLNNQDCDDNELCTRADLELSKTVTIGTPESNCIVAGDSRPSVYSVSVRNNGPSTARNVYVYERFPSTISVSYPTGCQLGSDGVVACFVGDLLVGDSVQFVFPFTVNANAVPGMINNTAWTRSTTIGNVLATIDPELCNNNATVFSVICAVADLDVRKTDGILSVVAGEPTVHVYNITGCNKGLSFAYNVRIEDFWPAAEAGFRRREIIGASDCNNTASGGSFVCNVGTLAPGQCVSICVRYTVDACAADCAACNTAVISSKATDPNPSDNTAQDCNQVTTVADLNVTKTDGVTSVVAGGGDQLTYIIRVCNAGPSCAQKVTLEDHFPLVVTQVPNSIRILNGRQGSCINTQGSTNFSCTLLTLQPNECVVVAVDYTVPASAQTCSIHNVVIVRSITFDPLLCNNVASDTNALIERANLTITKTAGGVTNLALNDYSPKYFSVTVFNNGPSVARDAVVTDIWPYDLCQYPESITFIPAQGRRAITTGGDITAHIGDIFPFTSVQMIIPFSACLRSRPGVAVNKVSVFSPTETECRHANYSITLANTKREHAERVVEKVASAPLPAPEMIIRHAEQTQKVHNPTMDATLSIVNVDVTTERSGNSFNVMVANPAKADVRILDVKLAGFDKEGKLVTIDLTKSGPGIKMTTCGSFAEHRIAHMWSESCSVELAIEISSARITVGGVSLQLDGRHIVMGSASL